MDRAAERSRQLPSWKVVANKILRSIGGTEAFHTNSCFSTDSMSSVNGLPKFYQGLLNLSTKFSFIPEEPVSKKHNRSASLE